MGKYKTPRGSRIYCNYTDENLEKAVVDVKKGDSYRKVSKRYRIPLGTLSNKVKNIHQSKAGGQRRLTMECEDLIVRTINTLTEWRSPVQAHDIRYIVKGYLDRRGIVDGTFKGNLPGKDWLYSFMNRHNFTRRIADNVKRSRAEVNGDVIRDYFKNLGRELEGISPENIFNYDETNMTDDPGAKTVIVRRGLSRVERIADHSKASTSVMFCGNAIGEYLPPMVVYKAHNLYEGWTKGGPAGAVYDSTKSGWFDMTTFTRWFKDVFLPFVAESDGPIAVIGDNLGSHFAPEVIELTEMHNIKFITLHPNSTHLCQPLDVAVFRSLKSNWHKILDQWKKESRHKGVVPKEHFPALLDRLCNDLAKEHLVSGFRATGIYPLNQEEVLKRLPDANRDPGGNGTAEALNESVLEVLKSHCGVGNEKAPVKRKRGPKVSPGTRITSVSIAKPNAPTKPIAPIVQVHFETNNALADNQPDPHDGEVPGPSNSNVVTTKGKGRMKKLSARMIDCDSSSSESSEAEESEVSSETDEEVIESDDYEGPSIKNNITWVCGDCGERWTDDTTDRWLVCDNKRCNTPFMLQCSGIDYEATEYYDVDIEKIQYLCEKCQY